MAVDQTQYSVGMDQDENGFPIPKIKVVIGDMVPTDNQGRRVETAPTHSGVLVGPTSSSGQTAWQQVPDGMSEFINNLAIDSSIANIYINVDWSEDGTNKSGSTTLTVSNTDNNNVKTSKQWYPIGGIFYKAAIVNLDAAGHTCSANIKFRP